MANEEPHAEDHEEEDIEDVEEKEEEKDEEEMAPQPRRRQERVTTRSPTRPSTGRRRFRPRRKVCSFCVDKRVIDYKDVGALQRFVDHHGKIIPRRKTGTCARHQRRLALAIKRARHLAMLPFTAGRSPYSE